MKGNASFRRKLIYIAAIGLMLLPLSYLSRPAAREADGNLNEGGVLSRMRTRHDLALTDLGEIDPASESMKLATLGLRGVAANILWTKANNYKKKEDYDNLRAALNQITKLQPNFVSVWIFQGWNISYNVSVEFDDYRSRFHWVKRGIDFLIEGTKFNRDEPRLLKEIGWFFAHKIGKADERVQYRRLFRNDTDFHRVIQPYVQLDESLGPDNKPDNWKVARLWYRKAQDAVDTRGMPLRGESPLVFNSHAPMALIKYAEAIEQDGYLDEKAQVAWNQALRDWLNFGSRDIPTSWGFDIRLNDGEAADAEVKRLTDELDQLVPGARQRLEVERRKALTDEQRKLLDTPDEELSSPLLLLKDRALESIAIEHRDIADQAPREVRSAAHKLAARIVEAEQRSDAIRRYATTVNFKYWRTRCEAEKTDEAIDARRYLFEGEQAYRDADLETAREKYEKSWDNWAVVFEKFPTLMEDTTADDLIEVILRYRDLLRQFDEPFPPPGFKLNRLLELHSDEIHPPQPTEDLPTAEEVERAIRGER